jgi:precorrin isomerase
MQARELTRWPVPDGLLDRLGLPAHEIEARSRRAAQELTGDRWHGEEAGLVASLVYAAGDPGLVDHVRLCGDPVGRARMALKGLNLAAEAKEALLASGLPSVTVTGTRGGSGLAAAAVNFLLEVR